jgi:ABC-2 type transport system ATP-binding protein
VRVIELESLDQNRSVVTVRASGLTAEALAGLGNWGRDIQTKNGQVTMTIRTESDLPEITRYLVAQNVEVYAITPNRMSLEEIFIETVGEDGGL